MNLALKSIQHKVYGFTFLVDVIINIELSEVADKEFIKNRDKELKAFFSRFFQVDFNPDEITGDKGISLNNGNGIMYVFSDELISVRIRRVAYKSFLETALTALFPLKQFYYNVLGLKSIDDIYVLKRSLFPFNSEDKDKTPDIKEIGPTVFSQEFIDFPVDEDMDIPGAVSKVQFKNFVDGDIELGISAGIGSSKINPGSYGVVLDILARPESDANITEGEFDKRLLELNDKIFDAFHWVVSDKIISLMEEK